MPAAWTLLYFTALQLQLTEIHGKSLTVQYCTHPTESALELYASVPLGLPGAMLLQEAAVLRKSSKPPGVKMPGWWVGAL